MMDRRSLFVNMAAGLGGFSRQGEMAEAADRFDRAAEVERRLAEALDALDGTLAEWQEDELQTDFEQASEELAEAETALAVLIDPAAREFDQESHRDGRESVGAVIGGRLYTVVLDSAYNRPRVYRVAV